MSFANLIYVIGPSPSEMTNKELLTKQSIERERVRRTITWYRETQLTPKASRKTKAKAKAKAKSAPSAFAKAGLTLEQLQLAIKLKRQQEGV